MIYRKYFGAAITVRLLAVLWAVMSVGGLAVEYLFRAVQISTPVRPRMVVHTGFAWNYTSVLNIVALIAFAGLYRLYRQRDLGAADSPYAKDPICGMQVEKAHAPATLTVGGEQYWFCCDGCRDRFAGKNQAPEPQFLGGIGTRPLSIHESGQE